MAGGYINVGMKYLEIHQLKIVNSVAQTKEYNIKIHFETNHGDKYGKYDIEEKRQLAEKLTKNLQGQQQVLTRSSEGEIANTIVSFEIAKILTKHHKPFSDGQIGHTIVKRVEDMGSDIAYQLNVKLSDIECYSLALDESTDIRDSAQLAVFIRAVDKDFNVAEELLDLNPLKGTTRGVDILEGIHASLQKMGFRKCVSLCRYVHHL
ncbi:general transcription factor II-I repeat domain-containing protein 2B-like [Lepeophtheirus salmonis]|uniref:general transcription factor II-I repeat domain-containing protein 2B-like n=1 Tax=Lepeophtheirus salmonis TaxID=72036 RepID=UPI003AF336AC